MLAIFKNVHTYYISGIVIAVIGGVYFYHSHPKIEIKTVTTTEIKTVDRVVYVDRVIDRNIVTHTKKTIHRKNGDIITIASNSQDLSKVDTKSQSNTKSQEKDVTKTVDKKIYQSSYQFTVLYPTQFSSLTSPLDYTNTQAIVGARLGNLPLFLDLGTNLKFNQVSIGLTLEL